MKGSTVVAMTAGWMLGAIVQIITESTVMTILSVICFMSILAYFDFLKEEG